MSPPLGSPDQEIIEFYVDNFSRVPLNTTLFIGQRVIILVLLVSVVRAACGRLDLAAILSLARSPSPASSSAPRAWARSAVTEGVRP